VCSDNSRKPNDKGTLHYSIVDSRHWIPRSTETASWIYGLHLDICYPKRNEPENIEKSHIVKQYIINKLR